MSAGPEQIPDQEYEDFAFAFVETLARLLAHNGSREIADFMESAVAVGRGMRRHISDCAFSQPQTPLVLYVALQLDDLACVLEERNIRSAGLIRAIEQALVIPEHRAAAS